MKHKIVNFRADRISGWFYDPEAGDARGVLDLVVEGKPVAALVCKVFRDELSPDEFPTRNVGFVGALPPVFWTGESYNAALRDRRTGQILDEKRLETRDFRYRHSPGFSGDFQLTDRGELAGWVARGAEVVSVRVFVDGHQVDDSVADHKKVLWTTDRLSLTAPPGYAYSFQIPVEYFDDQEHRVQVVADPDSEEVAVLEQRSTLRSEHAKVAEEQTERLRTGRTDWARRWRKAARAREDIHTARLELTHSYAAVTLQGDVQHNRAVLRIGHETVPLRWVSELHPEDKRRGKRKKLGRYAGELPAAAQLPAELKLHVEGDDLAGTYDVRLGDDSGRRPGALPEQLAVAAEGELLMSPVQMEAGCLRGWVLDTSDLNSPAELILLSVPEEKELARTLADLPMKELRQNHGIRGTGGFSLTIPPRAIDGQSSHLQLIAAVKDEVRVVWEDRKFSASREFLVRQALEASSAQDVVSLMRRVRATGRTDAVSEFLTRHQSAAAMLGLDDIRALLDSGDEHGAGGLEAASGAVWYWVNELRENSGRVQWFTQNAIRNRMSDARDILAYAASKGRYDFAQLHGLLESSRADLFAEQARGALTRDSWTSAALCLAQFLYCAPRDETDQLDSLTLYRLVEEFVGLNAIRSTDRAYYGDLLTWRGDFDNAWRVLTAGDTDPEHEYSQKLLALNAVNPHLTGDSESATAWANTFNGLLEQSGLGQLAPLDRVSFYELPTQMDRDSLADEDGPLVSVIMPIYEPSEATDVAVRSLLGQTWRNLEIIVVDDCSPQVDEDGNTTRYRQQLESFAAADPRVMVVFKDVNRGSYSVRNDGLDLASGEFVTVADKDDWHHPQQIELQVRHLQRNPGVVANMTNWARVDENLKLMLRSATGRVAYPSMPSLMFRREQVLKDVGYWDMVRKSGDSEFKSRIENFYGFKIEPINQAPMALALMEGQNLTKNDMGVGYLAPDRRSYLRAYKRWHREIREEGASAYMPKSPEARKFVAPPEYLPARAPEARHYDVVFASEFGFVAGNSTSLFTEISICLDAGLKVGVIPFQNGLIPSAAKRQFNRKIDDLVLTGQIDRLSLDNEAEADLLIVRWPTALQAVRDEGAGLSVKRAVVVANHPPFEPGGRRSYDIGVVTRNVERLFGVRPTWAPQSEQIGAMLEPLMPTADLEDFSWKGIVEIKDSATRNRFHEGVPTIGRHGRDDPAKWPSDRSAFRSVYPVDGSARVCILGGANVPMRKGFLSRNAPGWEIYAFNEIDVDVYLDNKIDFFVYFHSDDWVEAFGMAILEAMSHGVVCVLPHTFEPVFKEAATYCAPHEVSSTLNNLWSADKYAEQQQRALRFIARECTTSAYLKRLSKLGVGV